MPERLYLLLPLGAGFLYALSAMSLKPVMNGGYGPFRTAFVTQAVVTLFFGSLLLLVEGPLIPDPFWPSLLAGAIFSFGGLCITYVLMKGDLSIATPIMGTKVVLVALLLVVFLGEELDPVIWVSTAITLLGIVVLNLRCGDSGRAHPHAFFTVVLSLVSAGAYALVDVLFQYWCGKQGFYLFAAWSTICAGAFTFLIVPFFNGPLWRVPRGSVKYLVLGSVGMSVQAVAMGMGIGYFGDAAGSNIVYSGRGVWSVLLVWWIGHWFQNDEKHVGMGTMIYRVIGASLITVGIVILFI